MHAEAKQAVRQTVTRQAAKKARKASPPAPAAEPEGRRITAHRQGKRWLQGSKLPQAVTEHLLCPPALCRVVLVGASEYFRTRILRWEGDPWSQHGADGKPVLVEECEEGEVEAAVAVVRLMYEAELPPGLSALQLAQVRAACELCYIDKCI